MPRAMCDIGNRNERCQVSAWDKPCSVIEANRNAMSRAWKTILLRMQFLLMTPHLPQPKAKMPILQGMEAVCCCRQVQYTRHHSRNATKCGLCRMARISNCSLRKDGGAIGPQPGLGKCLRQKWRPCCRLLTLTQMRTGGEIILSRVIVIISVCL